MVYINTLLVQKVLAEKDWLRPNWGSKKARVDSCKGWPPPLSELSRDSNFGTTSEV
jgi:hypothetical protein